MGNRIAIAKKIVVYVDLSPPGEVQQVNFNIVSNYLQNHTEKYRLFVFIKSQSAVSTKIWQNFIGKKFDLQCRVRIVQENLINDDPYISVLYHLNRIYIRELVTPIQVDCLFLPEQVGLISRLEEDYPKFKQQLRNRHYFRKLRMWLIDPRTYQEIKV